MSSFFEKKDGRNEKLKKSKNIFKDEIMISS